MQFRRLGRNEPGANQPSSKTAFPAESGNFTARPMANFQAAYPADNTGRATGAGRGIDFQAAYPADNVEDGDDAEFVNFQVAYPADNWLEKRKRVLDVFPSCLSGR